MQNQPYQKSFLNPTATAFTTTRARTSNFTSFATDQREAVVPREEAWTQYDGLGPVPRDPKLDRNWRQSAPPGRGQQSGSGRGSGNQGRGGYNQQHQRGEPATKRSKQTPQSQNKQHPPHPRSLRGGGRPAARSSGEVIDEDYLAQTYPPLRKEDYPNANSAMFKNPKSFFWDTKGSNCRSTFVSQRGGMYQCTVFIKTADGQRIEAVGDATNKKIAERIACQHAVLKLHHSGQLKDLVYGGIHSGAFDQNLLKEEEDAKMDIYDYCARYDTVPQFITADNVRPAGRKPVVQVTIKMPEQGIEATARATDRRVADILASVEFKRQAENWHAKHGDENILVKDVANVLNSRNAKKLFEFYKIHNPSATWSCDPRPVRGKSRKIAASMTQGQVLLNGEPIGEPVEMGGKKTAETAAWVTAAVALKNQNPDLFPKFIEALRMGNGEILKPIQPTWLNIEQDSVIAMTDTLLSVRRIGLPPTEEEMAFEDSKLDNTRRYHKRKLDPALATVKSKKMLAEHEAYLNDEKLSVLRQKRSELPMNQYTAHVLDLVNNNEVSIIVGATGSGKTTQVPQILLEEATRAGKAADCNVICTQPRRIAATSVAQRVAVERNEPLQKSVGYQVRFDAKLPLAGGSITYCTTGILLQQLRNNPEEVLDGITHLVIDEVHERDIMIDYLLIILKRILKHRRLNGKPSVKVVLMSATMNTELFSRYFGHKDEDGNFVGCPHLSVPGRTFPVKEFYLEDIRDMLKAYPSGQLGLLREDDTRSYLAIEEHFTPPPIPASGVTSAVPSAVPSRAATPGLDGDDSGEAVINWKQEVSIRADGQAAVTTEKDDAIVPIGLAAITLAHVVNTTDDGAVLVFLPGLDEILKLEETLTKGRPLGIDFNDTDKYKLYMLHSSIPNQNEVFDDIAEGCRKIILSTNIAETSITIPDVKFVVDAGKLREKQYEQARRITQLVCTWVSKSNSKQRAGRAGRVQNGNYYALFSRNRFDSLRPTGLPEMLRSDLQEICLDIKLQGFKDPIARFLSEAIEPPSPHAIDASLRQLMALGAIDQDEKLTQLGHVLATMPVEPALGKMILLAVIFRCLDPILILGASAAGRDVFVNPPERRQEATRARHSFTRDTGSDHMAVINAFQAWRESRDRDGVYAAHRYAEQNFLHRGALKVLDQTAKQVQEILSDIGIIPRMGYADRNKSMFGHPSLNANSGCVPLIKALTLAGMYPNLAVCTGGRGLRTVMENFTMIHPSSVHYSARDNNNVPLGSIFTYTTKAKSNDGSSILLRQTTQSTQLAALLFGGRLRLYNNILEIDSWLPFKSRENHAKATIEFKKCLDRLLAHAFRSLSKRNSGTQGYLADDPARETFAQGIVEVLEADAGIRKERSGWGRDSYRPASRSSDRFGSRPVSRNDDRFPPLSSNRPDSRNADRFSGFGGRPDSRNADWFPPPLGSRPASRSMDRFPPLGGRPSSRTGDRLGPNDRIGSNDRSRGPPSRPDSRNNDRFTPLGSRPSSRTDNRFGGDVQTGNIRTFGSSDARLEARHNAQGNSGYGQADRYRPDPRLQGRWR